MTWGESHKPTFVAPYNKVWFSACLGTCQCVHLPPPPIMDSTYFSSMLLHSTNDDQLILWKLSSIRMKIFYDIACNLNWNGLNLNSYIEFKYIKWNLNWIELNSNSTKFNYNSTIRLRFNWVELKFNWREYLGCKLVKLLNTYSWIWCWQKEL
jgi:hypothetical protein